MSEHAPHKPEHVGSHETAEHAPKHREHKHEYEKAAEQAEKRSHEQLEAIRKSIQHEATSKDEVMPHEAHEPSQSPLGIGSDLKKQNLYRTLKNLRNHLSAPERTLSKIVHQPVVEAVSELGGKTIGRPSGLLSGGVCAFAGSLTFLYIARHSGFRYNYLMFIVFFAGGFAIGLALELVVGLARRLRR
jgi:hypothetical protein